MAVVSCKAAVSLVLAEAVMLTQLQLLKEPRSATMEEVTAVHDLEYVQQLKDTAENKAPTVVADFDDPDGFTYMTSTSFDDALKVTCQADTAGWILHTMTPKYRSFTCALLHSIQYTAKATKHRHPEPSVMGRMQNTLC